MTQAFQWSDRYDTGIAVVDEQHHQIVNMLNQIGEIPQEGVTIDQIGDIVNSLAQYAIFHFETEDALMVQHRVDRRHLTMHRKAHSGFLRQALQMREASKDDLVKLPVSMLTFLTSWLSYHILGIDQSMSRQITSICHGLSPSEAFEKERSQVDVSTDVLIKALSNLYEQLGAYSAGLTQANFLLRETNQALTLERAAQEQLIDKLSGAQTQLLQSEKLAGIGQLAAGVAHEINNPIGFVSANLGTLKEYVTDLFELLDTYEQAQRAPGVEAQVAARLAEARERVELEYLKQDMPILLAESQAGLHRVKRIVQDLKDFSRIDQSGWFMADLNEGMASALNVVSNELKSKAAVICEHGIVPPIQCIPGQLNQVFMNLLVNAAHAFDEFGTITVRSGEFAEEVWMEVADTGRGIAPEVLSRIFEPFFTTKPVGQGTGLGLSISYGIVAKHHGRIDVHSVLGKGSTFRIWLPKVQPLASPSAAPSSAMSV